MTCRTVDTEMGGQLQVPAALPTRKELLPPVPTGQEAGWAPEPVWTPQRTEIPLGLAGSQTLAVQPVAISNGISLLQKTKGRFLTIITFLVTHLSVTNFHQRP
jgi:hypothetical protein